MTERDGRKDSFGEFLDECEDDFDQPENFNNNQNNPISSKTSHYSNSITNNENQTSDNEILLLEKILKNSGNSRCLCADREFGGPRNCENYLTIDFDARWIISTLRDFYNKLLNERINLYYINETLYIYSSNFDNKLETIAIYFNEEENSEFFMSKTKNAKIRVNFSLRDLLCNLDLNNYYNKEKITFDFCVKRNQNNNKSKLNKKPESANPFFDQTEEEKNYEIEYNFPDEAIEGFLVVTTKTCFKFNIPCNFAPKNLIHAPFTKEQIFNNYFFKLDLSNLPKIKPVDIYCNPYFYSVSYDDMTETYMEYSRDNEENNFNIKSLISYIKIIDPTLIEQDLYNKMIKLSLSKEELDSFNILRNNENKICFYADKKYRMYFIENKNKEGYRTKSVIVRSRERKPALLNVEDCCFYDQNWEKWLNTFSQHLPLDKVKELKMKRVNKGNIMKETGNKKQKKKKKDDNNMKIDKFLINNENINNNEEKLNLNIFGLDNEINICNNKHLLDIFHFNNSDENNNTFNKIGELQSGNKNKLNSQNSQYSQNNNNGDNPFDF